MIDGASPPSIFERDSRKNENAERLMTCCDFFSRASKNALDRYGKMYHNTNGTINHKGERHEKEERAV